MVNHLQRLFAIRHTALLNDDRLSITTVTWKIMECEFACTDQDLQLWLLQVLLWLQSRQSIWNYFPHRQWAVFGGSQLELLSLNERNQTLAFDLYCKWASRSYHIPPNINPTPVHNEMQCKVAEIWLHIQIWSLDDFIFGLQTDASKLLGKIIVLIELA